MDYEQMEIDITLESDRDLKENMQATAKFALGQIMEYQHPTKVKNRHEGYGIAAEGYASLQGKMKSTKTDMDDLLKTPAEWRRRCPQCNRQPLQFSG
jgi:hypothetical protein